MKVNNSGPADPEGVPTVYGKTYDEIYIESWEAVIEQCQKKLESDDYERALQVRDLEAFRRELDTLQDQYSDQAPKHVVLLLYPTLPHYEQFSKSFVKMMSDKADISMMWGLLYLVVKLSFESEGTIERITHMLEKMGHKLQTLNRCAQLLQDLSQIKGDAIEINREIIVLWLNIIMLFRTQTYGPVNQVIWKSLSEMYDEAMRNIGDAVVRIEKCANAAERQAHMIDMEMLRKIVSPQVLAPDLGQLPCHMLPVAANSRFFGRKQVLQTIEGRLGQSNSSKGLHSLAIYGLGGIGKSQIAMAYAYAKIGELDAVFWVPAEDELSLQHGFSQIAVYGLKLPGAQIHAHQENVFRVMNWFQQTPSKWLLVFDNVEDHHLLSSYWPVANQGAILITTRRRVVASQPVEAGLEIKNFSTEEGASLLVHLLGDRKVNADEQDAALDLSEKLGGHALAISQMAAYMNARTMLVRKFLDLYNRYPQRLHREKKAGWTYVGYNHSLDTVWDISLGALDDSAKMCLGIFCFCFPDSIPTILLEPSDPTITSDSVSFCEDELSRWDVIEQLEDHALARHNLDQQTFSLHRLVQAEALFRMSANERQEAFNCAVKLIADKFPRRGSTVATGHLANEGDVWLTHITSLARNWKDSQLKPEPLRSTPEFCNLMVDCTSYVNDIDTANITTFIIDTGYEAYQVLSDTDKNPMLLADVLRLQSVRDVMEGDFKIAEDRACKAYQTYLDHNGPENLTKAYFENILGLIYDSRLRHEKARSCWNKCLAMLKGHNEDVYLMYACQINLNSARNLYSTGDFVLAEQQLDSALEGTTKLGTWFLLAFVHMAYTSLFTRTGDLERASHSIQQAADVLNKTGGPVQIGWLSSLCSYHAARVAILRGEAQKAIDEAKKAVAIGRTSKCTIGTRARLAHVLSKALFLDPGQHKEAEEARQEAQRLRKLLPEGRTNLEDESDAAFELLVVIIWR